MKNQKGENWSKFRKEMVGLGKAGYLGDKVQTPGGIIHNDNAIITPAKRKVTKAPQKKILTDVGQGLPKHKIKQVRREAQHIKKVQQAAINGHIEEEMKTLLPKWAFWLCEKKGWRWHLKLLGIRIRISREGRGQMFPTVVAITVWGQRHSVQRFNWQV